MSTYILLQVSLLSLVKGFGISLKNHKENEKIAKLVVQKNKKHETQRTFLYKVHMKKIHFRKHIEYFAYVTY